MNSLKTKKKHSSMDKKYKIQKNLFWRCFGAFSAKKDFL